MELYRDMVMVRAFTFYAFMGLICAMPARAEVKPEVTRLPQPPHSALYVGNSFFYYNNSLHSHVREFVLRGESKNNFRSFSATISGSGLDWHDVASYFRPNAVGSYSFDAKNRVIFAPKDRKPYDVTIMMDCSQCPVHPDLKTVFAESAEKDAAIVRAHGAEPVFFMSWAYQDVPEMTGELADAYTEMGNKLKALVIPAGLAFAKSQALSPEINLYQKDKRHPTLAGTYLAAATTYAALFGKSPVGNSYTADLADEVAAKLQAAAWATVQDYFKP